MAQSSESDDQDDGPETPSFEQVLLACLLAVVLGPFIVMYFWLTGWSLPGGTIPTNRDKDDPRL